MPTIKDALDIIGNLAVAALGTVSVTVGSGALKPGSSFVLAK